MYSILKKCITQDDRHRWCARILQREYKTPLFLAQSNEIAESIVQSEIGVKGIYPFDQSLDA